MTANTWQRTNLATSRGEFSVLRWDAAGRSAPLLHFAHANGFNAQTYVRLLGPLSERFRIVAWDARGHGLTNASADPAMLGRDWSVYVDDLCAVVETLGEPLVLAGHSLGAVVSMELAASGHDLVQG